MRVRRRWPSSSLARALRATRSKAPSTRRRGGGVQRSEQDERAGVGSWGHSFRPLQGRGHRRLVPRNCAPSLHARNLLRRRRRAERSDERGGDLRAVPDAYRQLTLATHGCATPLHNAWGTVGPRRDRIVVFRRRKCCPTNCSLEERADPVWQMGWAQESTYNFTLVLWSTSSGIHWTRSCAIARTPRWAPAACLPHR
jgi:hypothetical protein